MYLVSNLIDRGYGKVQDFFNIKHSDMDIVTNPPYKIALPFLKYAPGILFRTVKRALFLRVLFLEGKERGRFFKENPPKKIYVASGRLSCAKNGDFEKYRKSNAQKSVCLVRLGKRF